MAGFELKKDPMDTQVIECATSSLAVEIGDLLERTAGSTTWAATSATSAYFTEKAVAVEAIASSASVVKAIVVHPFQEWAAECASTASASDNGDRMVLTDANTVNNSGTDVTTEYACFKQIGITADGRVIGRILVGSGVDPDATTT